MDYILKACAIAIISTILYLLLANKNKDMASIVTAMACCLILLGLVAYLKPILDLIHQLRDIGNLENSFLSILFKAAGVGLIVEICSLLCTDLGNSALGKTLQISASAIILWLSLPLFSELLSVLMDILEEL